MGYFYSSAMLWATRLISKIQKDFEHKVVIYLKAKFLQELNGTKLRNQSTSAEY